MAFKIAEAFVEIKDNTATVNRNLLALTTGVGRFESSSTKSFLSVSKALTGVGVVAVGVTAAFSTLTYALIRTGKSIISAGISFDQMRRGLTAVMGSADGARQEIVKLREVAKLPGLGMREALQGSINLQAVGFEAGKTRQILMEFGNALVTVGKGKAELDGVTLALTQMKARGKILAEEINQLSERVPQVRKVMMDAFGTGTAEDIQKLGVSVEDFIDVLVNGLGRLPRVAGGAALALENIADAADSIKRTFADMLLPFVEQFLDEAGNVVTAIDDWLGALTKFDNETRQKFAELTFIGVEMIKVMMKFMAKSVLEVAKVMWVPIETYMKSTLYDASNFIAKWVGRFGGYIIGGQEGALAGEAALTGDPQQRASVKAWIAQGGETKLNQQLQKSQEFFTGNKGGR